MARFLLIVVLVIIGGLGYLAVHYMKDSYKVLPASDAPENALESQLDAETETDYQNWIEFSPPAGTFKVLMPSKPEHVSDKSNDPKTKIKRVDDVYLAERKNGSVFMIHLITYPDQQQAMTAEEGLLENFMHDMLASNPNNKLVASQPAMFKGQKALDFVIENDSFNYDVRTFLENKTVIVLASIAKKPFHNVKDFEFFINSFELSPADQKALN